MKISARIKFKDVLRMLNVTTIPGCDDDPNDWIDFIECVDITDTDLPECDLCGGEGCPEPEPAVNSALIADFIRAIRDGHIRTAQQLVGRVFEHEEDVADVERALCRCAA